MRMRQSADSEVRRKFWEHYLAQWQAVGLSQAEYYRRHRGDRGSMPSVVVERPQPNRVQPQNLCLDEAYDNPTGHTTVVTHNYTGHIHRIGEEKLSPAGEKRYPARRVERTLGWLSKCRRILVRYAKKAENYLAELQLACALIWYRRLAYSSF